MKDKKLEGIVNKLYQYKEETYLNSFHALQIDKAIDILNKIEPARLSIPNVSMADSTKAQMIKFFYDRYYNTNQDAINFAEEFYFVVGEISIGMVPIKLERLTGFLDDLTKEFPEFKFDTYKEVQDLMKEEIMPF